MSRSPRVPRALLLVASLVMTLLASARPAHAAVVVGVEFGAGISTYAMGAVNDTLHVLNDFLGTELPDIGAGTDGLVALRIWPNDRLLVRVAIESMLAESEFSIVDSLGYGGTPSYDTTPVATTLTATWFFNRRRPGASVSAPASVGIRSMARSRARIIAVSV
jgi:hypothetical protein